MLYKLVWSTLVFSRFISLLVILDLPLQIFLITPMFSPFFLGIWFSRSILKILQAQNALKRLLKSSQDLNLQMCTLSS